MPASTEQKVDFLLKKIGYSASKTGGVEGSSGTVSGTKKSPHEEALPSPLVIPSTNIWADSSLIPSTPPTTSAHPVGVHTTGSAYRLTHDSTAAGSNIYRSFIARSTHGNQSASIDGNWIDSQFGADYAIRVFVGVATDSSNEVSQAGANAGTDTWFFDYSSGILNFNGTNLPTGITTNNVYLVGYRYTGGTGVKPPIGVGTFSSLNVTGIATFHKDVEFIGVGDAGIKSTFWDQSASSLKFLDNVKAEFGDSQDLQLYHLSGNSYVKNTSAGSLLIQGDTIDLRPGSGDTGEVMVRAVRNAQVEIRHDNVPKLVTTGYGVTVTGLRSIGISTLSGDVRAGANLSVAGLSTFTQLVDINGGGQANTFKVEDLTAGRVTYAGAGGELQDSSNLTFDGTDLTAASAKISDLTDNRVVLAGTSGALEDSGNLTFDANSNLNITGGLVVSGITTLGSVGISTGLISGPATMYIDPATVGDNTGLLVVKGNLQVDGTQTTVNSATMTVTDKNIEIAKGAANDAAADGAGITIDSGDGDKTLNWVDATDAWTSSEHIQVAAGKRLGFADDPNTYIDRPSADSIRFTAGGSEKVRIQTDGNTKITGALNVTGITTSARLNVTGITTVATLNVGVSGQTLVGITTILDEDNMASDSAAALATQQSIKAYVDTQVTAQDLDFVGDSGTGSVDLDSQSLDIEGTANEIETVAANQKITIGLPDDVTIANDLTVASNAGIGSLSVTGVSTFTGNIDANGNLDVDGRSELDIVNIAETLNVVGISTFQDDIRLPDDKKIKLGASNDFQIYHQSSATEGTYITNSAGNITFKNTAAGQYNYIHADKIHLRSTTNNEAFLTALYNGSVLLFHNNVEKLETLQRGVGIGGSIHIDNDAYVTGITTTVQLKVGANPTVGITTILDEDNMASDSATALATQQSIKKYVDDQVTAQDLDFAGDSGTGAVDLDSQSLTLAGTSNEIETSASGQTITLGLPDNVTIGNDLTVTGNAGIGSLSVTGVSTFTGNIDANGNLDVDGQTEVDDINVAGVSTFVGVATFTSNHVYIDNKLFVGGIEISPGAGITTPNLDINDYIRHNGDLTTKFGFPTDGKVVTNISGTERISITSAGTYTTGIATATGVINSQTDVQINGTSVLTSALDEAVAMAIALG